MDLSVCRQEILNNALEVAKNCLEAQGLAFKEASSLEEVQANQEQFNRHLTVFNNLVVAASVWMQNYRFFDRKEIKETANKIASFVYRQADDCFYGQGDIDVALALYKLCVGLDPENEKYLSAVLSPCIQGDGLYPEIALPYAIVVASLNSARDEVEFIERLILNKQASYRLQDKQA